MKRLPEVGFGLDLEQLFAMVGPSTRVVAINSPSNPTGWSMPLDQMIALRDFARQRGLWILSDEVYNQRPLRASFRARPICSDIRTCSTSRRGAAPNSSAISPMCRRTRWRLSTRPFASPAR